MGRVYRNQQGAELVRDWCTRQLAQWPLVHRTTSIPTSLGETHVVSAGSGSDVCLFLPGTNFCAATSLPFVTTLAGGRRVYAVDLPGQTGLSAPTRPDHDVSGHRRWLAEIFRWVRSVHNVERLVLVGHSRGAAVALTAQPDQVDGLALLSPAGLCTPRLSVPLLRATLPWVLRRSGDESRKLLDYMSGAGHPYRPELVEWLTIVARTSHSTGAPRPLPDSVVAVWRDHDVTTVVGEDDPFFPPPRLGPRCWSALGREPVVLPGVGHLLVEEAPALAADLVAGLV